MAAKRKPARARKAKATVVRALPAPSASADGDLRGLVSDLAVLAAVNNLMAQTAFLSLERMRISSEVVDEGISNEFGTQLWERCEKLVQASDGLILQVLDRAGAQDERADLVRGLVQMRREFASRARKPKEQHRLAESLERMYR